MSNINSIQNGDSFWQAMWDGAVAGHIGGLAGGAAAATGGAVSGLFSAGGGFIGGATSGAASGAVGGAINGFGNTLYQTGDINAAFGAAGNQATWGAAIGGAAGGVFGGIDAMKDGRNFWNGKYDFIYEYQTPTLTFDYEEPTLSLDGMRSELEPMYMDSQLEFNGQNLELINNYSDGSQVVADSWSSISGPHGNGALPNGNYLGDNLRTRTVSGFTRDGVGFSVDLNPQFQTTRTLLRIHPDGGVNGTLGCIGIQENAARLNVFYNSMSTYFQRVSPSIRVIVY